MQPELFDPSIRYTVSSLTRRLRSLLESIPEYQNIWVEGEVLNISRPPSGHIYFTLKDATAQLRCVMWRNDASRIKFIPTDGTSIEAHGNLGIYEVGGQYQLYVNLINPLGEGALFAEFLRLKGILEAEGLFDPSRKRAIPERPETIGVVTSPTGAALRDILDTLGRRYPVAEVYVSPTPVQGVDAPEGLVAAIRKLNITISPDVILLARGGGSMEDLWAFNDEYVVREVAGSTAPVITGVGHETDFTLVDFASDLRAPTPTAAAELATPVTIADMKTGLLQMEYSLLNGMQSFLRISNEQLARIHDQLRYVSPSIKLQGEIQHLDEFSRRLNSAQLHQLTYVKSKLASMESRLMALNPISVLQRGYAVVTNKSNGMFVTDANTVHPGNDVLIRVQRGEFSARVINE